MTDHPNHPLMDCVNKADKIREEMPQCGIYQKFTCSHCGSRQTMAIPNVFYTRGTCEECGKETNIEKDGCNYMIINPDPEVVAMQATSQNSKPVQ